MPKCNPIFLPPPHKIAPPFLIIEGLTAIGQLKDRKLVQPKIMDTPA
jgi:hypothetical protein